MFGWFSRERDGSRETPRDEVGASAVEYGLLVAAIAALIVVIVFALGGIVKNVFQDTCNKVGTGASVATASCNP